MVLHAVKNEAHSESVLPKTVSAVDTKSSTNDPNKTQTAVIADVQTVQSRAASAPNVLLATAWVELYTPEGRRFKVRALLDQGSTFTFISESLCQLMRTKRHRADLQIRCFGHKYTGAAKSKVSLELSPCSKATPIFPFTAYVYQRLTSYAASQIRPLESWPHLRNLPLADPDPASQHTIHLLIGVDLYCSLLLGELRQGSPGTPTAQSTVLGWILSGPTGDVRRSGESASVLHCLSGESTNQLLQKFWEDEEVFQRLSLTEEEEQCERHFITTHSRTPQGRYIVRLPFKEGPPVELGESLPIAISLYNRTENRLSRLPELYVQYNDFLREYQALGHMNVVKDTDKSTYFPVYLPHHAVLIATSHTTKLRVVFNASCKTRDGTSLNDKLLTGSKLQSDLAAIILCWRQWRYVYTADIAKMFRQILVDCRDADFQRILWRPTEDSSMEHFRLVTVTYGLAPAPYLAMRVLKQLAHDEGHAFPRAAAVVENSFYVDDTLFGADDLNVLRDTRNQLIDLMNRGGFQLRQWVTNSSELLEDLPVNQHDPIDHLITKDDSLKILAYHGVRRRILFALLFIRKNQRLQAKARFYHLLPGCTTPSVGPRPSL